jgi:hypothetical protein
VLTVPGASITNGTLITQSDWTSGTEQQWQFTFLSAARESLNEEVQQNDPNNFVTVFPTLVKSELNIDYYSSISQTLHISMVNVQGSVKQKESFVLNKGLNRIKLDVNALDSGLYLVNTQTQSNGKASKKVIVIK